MSLGALARRLTASIGTFGSMVALVASLKPSDAAFTGWQYVLLTSFTIFGLLDFVFTTADYLRGRSTRLKSERSIRDYMFRWISTAGKVEIFSRDLSWVDDDEMEALLQRKAARSELTLVIPAAIPLSAELLAAGATVLTYPDLNYAMQSRFTVINSGRTDTAVAIGRTQNGVHLVEEFRAESGDPAFYLAQDLATVMHGFCKREVQI